MEIEKDNDTIAAISTPLGEGGIGIVRLSGPEALKIASEIFLRPQEKGRVQLEKDKKLKEQKFTLEPKKLHYGYIVDEEGKEIDEVLLAFMKAPHTYTREDVVEINAHGGIVPLRNILKLVLRKGARLAEPGEFTRRAYLNGRIDLLQAESILSIVRAKTEKGLNAALQTLKGALSGKIVKIRDELNNILSDIEVDVDFVHEDIDFGPEHRENIKERLKKMIEEAEILLEKRAQGKILQEGLKTVIIGKPNVGKSSLYNYFLGEERAIVTDIPGTTRDLLTEYVNLKGIPLKIMDTAGLRKDGDRVEKIGMELSKKAMEEADLLLFLLDASTGITEEDEWIYSQIPQNKGQTLVILINKMDLTRSLTAERVKQIFPCTLALEISLFTGEGLLQLADSLAELFFSGDLREEEGGALFLEERHGQLLSRILENLKDADSSLEKELPLDLVSIDLKEAQRLLGALLGEDTSEAVLDNIFQRFCIGK